MSFIVFDLEWNQPAFDKNNKIENRNLFEIIEIGAVKLDENRNIISKFNRIIKPQIYKKLNWHIQKILHIKMSDLKRGQVFSKAALDFIEWCGENPVFLSWGSQDLTEFQENMKYYNMKPLANGPIAYYDVQKLFGKQINEEETSKKLEDAIDYLNIKKDIQFHRAYSDAYYTAKVFKKLDQNIINEGMVFNIYHLPKNKFEEINLIQGKEYIYISQGYKERESISENRKILALNCLECQCRPIRPKVRWYSTNSKIYYGAAICKLHGPIKGKLKIRKHSNGLYFAEKILSYTTNEAVIEIKNRKNAVKKKTTVRQDSEIVNQKNN